MRKLKATIPVANIVISEVNGRAFLSIVSALVLSLGILSTVPAQSDPSHLIPALVAASEDNWTVLTMAPDGSWGVATNISSNRAITRAIADCKMMSQAKIGCGAQFTTIRAGWSLGIRCGDENIMAAGKTLAVAEKAAIKREVELRQIYLRDMPSCIRVVTIDPQGAAVIPPRKLGWNRKWISLGIYPDIDDLRDALDRAHMKIGESANEILSQQAFVVSKAQTEAIVVIISVADLGFEKEGASLADIHTRARLFGLELCPAEVGPMLRLKYLNQPIGEFIHIGMKPIAINNEKISDFTVANGGAGLLLLGGDADRDLILPPNVKFAFVLPRLAGNATAHLRNHRPKL